MCFSTTASFAASAILLPIGMFSIYASLNGKKEYLLLAAFPLLFGVQQLFEGMLWLSLEGNVTMDGKLAALCFLFFAYFLWPLLVPMAAGQPEPSRLRKQLFLVFGSLGGVFGATLFIPLVLDNTWLSFRVLGGSILYSPTLIYDGYIERDVVRLIYAVIVSVPLLFSSIKWIRRFGVLVLSSVIASAIFFEYAFVSIWCFFAALLSLYIAWMMKKMSPVASFSLYNRDETI